MSTLAFMYASLLAGAVAPTVAHAQGATAGPAMAHVTVQSIHAKNTEEKSTAPAALTKVLVRKFKMFKAFHLLGTTEFDLAEGKSGQHMLPDKKTVSVTYLGRQDEHLKLKLAFPGLKTEMRMKKGKTFYHVGAAYKGGKLIMSVSAKEAAAAKKK